MEIHLERLSDSPFEWQEELSIPRKEFEHPDLRALDPVSYSGRIELVGDGYVLRTRLAYRQTTACIRCLGDIEGSVEVASDYLILIKAAEDSSVERELEADELGLIRLTEPTLDTRPLVVEQVQLNIPMKPLCRPDCAGLCSRCGADLNTGSCSCAPSADPRWAALEALRDGGAESD